VRFFGCSVPAVGPDLTVFSAASFCRKMAPLSINRHGLNAAKFSIFRLAHGILGQLPHTRLFPIRVKMLLARPWVGSRDINRSIGEKFIFDECNGRPSLNSHLKGKNMFFAL
jgi:hypothetical protein